MRSFSIIIPFKTGKYYLKACIESIIAQTYKQFQIIILTDKTSNDDRSIDYLRSVKYSNIDIIESNDILDILGNWDRIKSVSKDEYMTILGYDDIIYPCFLEEINHLIDQFPHASLYHTYFDYIDKDGILLNECKPLPANLNSIAYLEMALKDQLSLMATGYVFKTSDYQKIGGINISYPNLIYADLQLWIDLAEISYLATSQKKSFAFRIHASTTKISKDKLIMNALLVFLNYLERLVSKNNDYKRVIELHTGHFLEQTTKSIAHRLLRTPIDERNGMQINDLVTNVRTSANRLGVKYHPEKINSFRIALVIEKYSVLSKLFLLFKRIYSKPIY